MKIEDIDDATIDRIWNREEVTDNLLWAKFWSLTESEARDYAKQRWFPDRHVNQNHITRKVKRFWPVIEGAVTRMRRDLERDPTFPKVWRSFNYDYTTGSLGYVMAGTRDEAKRLFDLFLPVCEAETGHARFVDLSFVAPIEEARIHCAVQNTSIAASMVESINEIQTNIRQVVERNEAKIAKIEARQDAFMILMASVGGGMADAEAPEPEVDNSSSDVVAEEVDF